MAARYRVVDLTAETATMAADRPTEVDPEDVARQLKDISDAIGPALTDAAPTGSFGLDSIELTLTIGAEGAVWFVAIPDVGDKPALIVSWQPIQQALHAAIVARITSVEKKRSLPTAVSLEPGEAGLNEGGSVLCHDLFTIDRSLFRRHAGTLSPPKLLEVEDALRRALDL